MIITTVVLSGNRTGGSMRSRSWVGLLTGAALAAVLTTFTTAPAWADVAVIPVPVIPTDTITVDGIYSAGSGVGTAPFVAGPFTLSFSVPGYSFVSTGSPLSENVIGTGSYTNGGTTTTFSNGQLNSLANANGFQVGGYIGPITNNSMLVLFTVTTTDPIFTITTDPGYTEYSLIPGSYALASVGNSAVYVIDPPFTGGPVVITGPANNSVPEPATAALLLAPLGALAFLRRRPSGA